MCPRWARVPLSSPATHHLLLPWATSLTTPFPEIPGSIGLQCSPKPTFSVEPTPTACADSPPGSRLFSSYLIAYPPDLRGPQNTGMGCCFWLSCRMGTTILFMGSFQGFRTLVLACSRTVAAMTCRATFPEALPSSQSPETSASTQALPSQKHKPAGENKITVARTKLCRMPHFTHAHCHLKIIYTYSPQQKKKKKAAAVKFFFFLKNILQKYFTNLTMACNSSPAIRAINPISPPLPPGLPMWAAAVPGS